MPAEVPSESEIRRRAAEAGQDGVFRFWDVLSPTNRARLLSELAEVDFPLLTRLVRELILTEHRPTVPTDLEPAPFVPLPTTDADRRRRRRMHRLGQEVLAAGKVAALVVAGGQGTRLGYEGPKGAFPIGPVSERPLFQVFAEGILAARRAGGASIPWYIMTSRANDQTTRDFFEAHNYFDLARADVKFFTQGMMPAVDFSGQLILAEKDGLFWSPDGHGGTLKALARSGMLADMRERGIEHVSYFQVDNPLVPPLDPVFIGYHVDAAGEMSSKMARKRDASEGLGHFCMSGGRLVVIEYTDMPRELAAQRDSGGRLRFEAGSIAIHLIARPFVERLTSDERFALPFHRADKKIPCVGADGRALEPAKPNGAKFETFIFDALPMAANPLVLEVNRAREFSPVKNATGRDSPATARRDMVRLAAEQLQEAGVEVPRDERGDPKFQVEISPLAAHSIEELKAEVARRDIRHIAQDLCLGPPEE